MQDKSTLEKILLEAQWLFEPLITKVALEPPHGFISYCAHLEIELEDVLKDTGQLEPILTDLEAIYNTISDALEEESLNYNELMALIPAVKDLVQSLKKLEKLDLKVEAAFTAKEIVKIIIDDLLLSYLRLRAVKVFEVLRLAGGIRQEGERYTIDWGKLLDFIKDPLDTIQDNYQWDTPDFNAYDLLSNIQTLLWNFGLETYYLRPYANQLNFIEYSSSPETEGTDLQLRIPFFQFVKEGKFIESGVSILPDTIEEESRSRLAVFLYGEAELSKEIPLDNGWKLSFESNLESTDNFGIDITSGGVAVKKLDKSSIPKLSLAFGIDKSAGESQSLSLLDIAGSKLTIGSIGAMAKAQVVEGEPELLLSFLVKKAQFQFNVGNGDSFLGNVVPADDSSAITFDFVLGFSSKRGLFFEGSGSFDIVLPTHFSLGPVEFRDIKLSISPSLEAIPLGLSSNIKASLGPFTTIIENVGIQLVARFYGLDSDKGNLGPVGLALGFKPPNGIAMSLDSSVSGGGYIAFYPEEERYYGALSLSFKDQFTFSAIGIIETRLPDDPEGFSMLLLVNVEFTPALSLGMNFYLSGLGGIIGLHRTINIDALRDGVKEDTVDQIMFPDNPIENITGIIQNLENFFPPQKGQFFFGVMALISWNTPPLLTIEAGIIIEFSKPTRLVILGILRCLLPKPEKALVELNVNLLGIIDFDNKFLSCDASIFNSRIASITLEGDMAFRLSWGKKKAFLLSIGGFHPSYSPPAHLSIKPMKRLTMNLLGSDNPSLILTTYFAITSNTVQFGAQIDLFIKIKKFSIYGFFGFDVLFQFSPFRFIANVRAGLEIKWGSKTLFGIRLEFELSGPGPWVAKGVAKFSILFITIKVRFKKTIGKKREPFLPSTQVLSMLKEELDKPENWTGSLPESHFPLVVLRESQVEEGVVLMDAFGALSIEQQALPLNSTIDKVGNYAPEDLSRASISRVTILGQEQPAEFLLEAQSGLEKGLDSLRQAFAPAAYKQLSIDERLAAQDFVDMDSGVQLRTGRLRGGNAKKRLMAYEMPPNPSPDKGIAIGFFPPLRQGIPAIMMSKMASNGAVSYSRLARVLGNRSLAPLVELRETPYIIVDTTTLALSTQVNFTAGTRVEAEEQLRRTLAGSPQLKEALRVAPVFETEL